MNACSVDEEDVGLEERASSLREHVDSLLGVPALVITFPTPELPQTSTIPYFPVGLGGLTTTSTITSAEDPNTMASSGERAQQGVDVRAVHTGSGGTGYPFLESEVTMESPSSKSPLAIVRARKKVIRSLFSNPVWLRKERPTRNLDNLKERRSLRAGADGPFGLGRSRRWFKASSSTRGTDHAHGQSDISGPAPGNGIAQADRSWWY